MSETIAQTTRIEDGSCPAGPDITGSAADLLLNCVLALLTPLLMASGMADVTLARLAAQQAIESTLEDGRTNLITAAQIVAFALTALDNLRLSMHEDVPLMIKLRLRANASALIRARVIRF